MLFQRNARQSHEIKKHQFVHQELRKGYKPETLTSVWFVRTFWQPTWPHPHWKEKKMAVPSSPQEHKIVSFGHRFLLSETVRHSSCAYLKKPCSRIHLHCNCLFNPNIFLLWKFSDFSSNPSFFKLLFAWNYAEVSETRTLLSSLKKDIFISLVWKTCVPTHYTAQQG